MPRGNRSGIVPWHMWGDTKTVSVRSSGGLVTFGQDQFSRINYARPETWSFLFAAEIVDASGQLAEGTVLSVHYDLSPGVGRSSVTLRDFHVFEFSYGGLSPVGVQLWTTTARNRVSSHGVPGPPPVPPADPTDTVNYTTTAWIDTFVAQDIQLAVRVGLDSAGEATAATVACHAYFSPRAHVRPEWFIHRFPGNEHGGS